MTRHAATRLTAGFLFTMLLTAGCGSPEPPELVQASNVVLHMMEPMNLSRSMFCVAFPECKPSEFVSYFFSSMGSAELPPSEEWADEMEKEQMAAIGAPLMPAGVAYSSREPDPSAGKQVVLRFDDERGVVIVDAYLDPAQPPVFTREWAIKKVMPAPGIDEIYQSNVEMGLSPRSF